ncbi:hypothetical protein OH492_05680 [Vibrio chagasii]|nr:hypothetical protein [Vibrio chagasii]
MYQEQVMRITSRSHGLRWVARICCVVRWK